MTTIRRTENSVAITDGTNDMLVLTNAVGADLVIAYVHPADGDKPHRIHDLVAIDLEAAAALRDFLAVNLVCPDHFVGTERLVCDTCGGTR